MADSENNQGGDDQGGQSDPLHDGVCRDFLRNVCRRGPRCRYKHPTKDEAQQLGLKKPEYIFCKDYQNSTCRRANCKFVHCTREEEEYHNTNMELPPRLQKAVDMGVPINEPLDESDIPVCKDFLKGDCHRNDRCKFRHLTMAEYEFDVEARMRRRAMEGYNGGGPPMSRGMGPGPNRGMGPGPGMSQFNDFGGPGMKRRHTELDYFGGGGGFDDNRGGGGGQVQEENAMLRARVEELKKKVSDLEATNEIILQQNARLRMESQNASASGNISQPTAAAAAATQAAVQAVAQQIGMNPNAMLQAHQNQGMGGMPATSMSSNYM